jgi:hypothetical protein
MGTPGVIAHWLYGRLDAHMSWDDRRLMAELDAYADRHVVGGARALTDAHRAAIKREHQHAWLLYMTVTHGYAG